MASAHIEIIGIGFKIFPLRPSLVSAVYSDNSADLGKPIVYLELIGHPQNRLRIVSRSPGFSLD
jgi:hypothetical protein